MPQQNISVIILYGGRSGEHEVSLVSAASVIKNFDRKAFNLIPIGIDREGRWWLNDLRDVDPLLDKPLQVISKSAQQIEPVEYFTHRDNCVVFPVMHGTFCEDGKLQGLLESANIPYVGAGVLSSAVCMDKDVAKRLLIERGLPVVPFVSFNQGIWNNDQEDICEGIFENLGKTVFVKPANMGSSVGCHKVKRPEDLIIAINDAFKYDVKVIVEQAINAREIECAVLENISYGEMPLVSVLGEIITKHEFYDYEAKYHDDTLQLVIPAKIEPELTAQIQEIASEAFDTLECEGMARVDFFLDKDTNQLYINELNTLPGFTHVSMYPMMWQATGLAYIDLLTALVGLAITRYERHAKLKVTPN